MCCDTKQQLSEYDLQSGSVFSVKSGCQLVSLFYASLLFGGFIAAWLALLALCRIDVDEGFDNTVVVRPVVDVSEVRAVVKVERLVAGLPLWAEALLFVVIVLLNESNAFPWAFYRWYQVGRSSIATRLTRSILKLSAACDWAEHLFSSNMTD